MTKSQKPAGRTKGKRARAAPKASQYRLRLYVAGLTPRSITAISSVKRICNEHLQGRYELEVINIYDQPALAKGEQIIAAPTLIKELPLPLRRLIGDMADTKKMLIGLNLVEKNE